MEFCLACEGEAVRAGVVPGDARVRMGEGVRVCTLEFW